MVAVIAGENFCPQAPQIRRPTPPLRKACGKNWRLETVEIFDNRYSTSLYVEGYEEGWLCTAFSIRAENAVKSHQMIISILNSDGGFILREGISKGYYKINYDCKQDTIEIIPLKTVIA